MLFEMTEIARMQAVFFKASLDAPPFTPTRKNSRNSGSSKNCGAAKEPSAETLLSGSAAIGFCLKKSSNPMHFP